MYEIYLTETGTDPAHPDRVADVLDVEGPEEASDICRIIQPYLRDGVEIHFARQTIASLESWADRIGR